MARRTNRSAATATDKARRIGSLTAWTGAVIGYFAPWVGRRPMTAALAWNAYDLFDLLRLLPSIETGALIVNLYTLRLPLIGLALLLPALLAKMSLAIRVVAGCVAAGLAATTLPPYPQIISAWRTPGWRTPFWWGIGCMAVALITIPIAPKLGRYRWWWILMLAGSTSVPAVATFARLQPALSDLHAARVNAGWGVWIYLTGISLIGFIAWYEIVTLGFAKE